MKKILIALFVLALLVVGVFVYAAMNVNSLVARFKPDIEKIASDALGSKVTLGKLEASVFPDAIIKVGEVKITGDSPQNSLTLNDLLLHIKLVPLLTGALDIEKLSLSHPHLVIEKDAQGIHLAGLPAAKKQISEGAQPAAATSRSRGAPEVPSGLKLNLERFALEDAQIEFKDLTEKKNYAATAVSVDTALAFKDNVVTISSFEISALLLKKAPIKITGKGMTFGLKEMALKVPSLTVTLLDNTIAANGYFSVKDGKGNGAFSSDRIDIASLSPLLQEFAPGAAPFAITGELAPKITANLTSTIYSATGTIGVKGLGATVNGIAISDGAGEIKVGAATSSKSAKSDSLRLQVNGKPLEIAFEGDLQGASDAYLRSLTVKAFGGSLGARGRVDLGGAKRFSGTTNIQSIDLSEAFGVLKPELGALVDGTLASLSMDVSGDLGPTLVKSLSGTGHINAEKCTIKGINLLSEILKSINSLPFIPGSLREAVPEDEISGLSENITIIDSLTANLKFASGSATTNDLVITNPQFLLSAQGSVGFDASLDLASSLALSEKLSKGLAARVKELTYALDDKNRLTIPVLLRGRPPKISLIPDVRKLIQLAAKRGLADKAEKALDKFLGGRGDSGRGDSDRGDSDHAKKSLNKLLGF